MTQIIFQPDDRHCIAKLIEGFMIGMALGFAKENEGYIFSSFLFAQYLSVQYLPYIRECYRHWVCAVGGLCFHGSYSRDTKHIKSQIYHVIVLYRIKTG